MQDKIIIKCPICLNLFETSDLNHNLSAVIENIENSYIKEMSYMEKEIEKLTIKIQEAEESKKKAISAQREIFRKSKKLIKTFDGILDLFPNQCEMSVFESPKIRNAEKIIEETNQYFKNFEGVK